MAGTLKGSELDDLRKKAKDLGIKSPEEWFEKDENYQKLSQTGREARMLLDIDKYRTYFDTMEKAKAEFADAQKDLAKTRKSADKWGAATAGVSAGVKQIPIANAISRVGMGKGVYEQALGNEAEHPDAALAGGIAGSVAGIALPLGTAGIAGKAGQFAKIANPLKRIAQGAKTGAVMAGAYNLGTRGVNETIEAIDDRQTAGEAAKKIAVSTAANSAAGAVGGGYSGWSPIKNIAGRIASTAGVEGGTNVAAYAGEQKALGEEFDEREAALQFGIGSILGGGMEYVGARGEKTKKPKNLVEKLPDEAAEPKKTDFLEGWKKLQEQSTAKPDDVIYADGDNPKQVGVEQKLIEQKKHEVIPEKYQLPLVEGEKPTVDMRVQGVEDRPQNFVMGDGKFDVVAGKEVPDFVLVENEQSIKNLQELNARMKKEADGYKSNEKVQKAFEESIAENEAEIARLREENAKAKEAEIPKAETAPIEEPKAETVEPKAMTLEEKKAEYARIAKEIEAEEAKIVERQAEQPKPQEQPVINPLKTIKKKLETVEKVEPPVETIPEAAVETPETAIKPQETIPVEESVDLPVKAAQTQNVAATDSPLKKRTKKAAYDKLLSIKPNLESAGYKVTTDKRFGKLYAEIDGVKREVILDENGKPHLKDVTGIEAETMRLVKVASEQVGDKAKEQNYPPLLVIDVRNNRGQDKKRYFIDVRELETGTWTINGNEKDYFSLRGSDVKRSRDNLYEDLSVEVLLPDGTKTSYIPYVEKRGNNTSGKPDNTTVVNDATLGQLDDAFNKIDVNGEGNVDLNLQEASGIPESARTTQGDYAPDDQIKMSDNKNHSSFNNGEYQPLGTVVVKNGDIIGAIKKAMEEDPSIFRDGKHKIVRKDGQVEIEFVLKGDKISDVKINGVPKTLEELTKQVNKYNYELMYDQDGKVKQALAPENKFYPDVAYTILRESGIDVKAREMGKGKRGVTDYDKKLIGVTKDLKEFGEMNTMVHTMLHEAGHDAIFADGILNEIKDISALRQMLDSRYENYDKRLAAYKDEVKPFEILADAIAVYLENPVWTQKANPEFFDLMRNLNSPTIRLIESVSLLTPEQRTEGVMKYVSQEMSRIREEKAALAQNKARVRKSADELKNDVIDDVKKLEAAYLNKDAYVYHLTKDATADEHNNLSHLLARKNNANTLADNAAARLQEVADLTYLDIAKGLAHQKGVKVDENIFKEARQLASEIVTYRRIAYEKRSGEVINTAFITPERAKEFLQTYDPTLLKVVENFHERFLSEFHETLKSNAGGMSEKQLSDYLDNEVYAKFAPQGHFLVPTEAGRADMKAMGVLDEKDRVVGKGGLFKHRTGSSDILFDPITATVIYARKIAMEAEMNNAKLATVKLLQKYAPETIRQTAGISGDTKIPVLSVRDGGKAATYIVPQSVAEAFVPLPSSPLAKSIGVVDKGVYYTQILYNPGWMYMSNIWRDQDRTARNLNKLWGIGHLEMMGRLLYVSASKNKRAELKARFGDLLKAEGRHNTVDIIKWSDNLPKEAQPEASALVKVFEFARDFVTPQGRVDAITKYENSSKLAAAWAVANKYQDGRSILNFWQGKNLGDKRMSDNDVYDFVSRYTGTPFSAEGGARKIFGVMYFSSIMQSLMRDIDIRYIHNRDGAAGVAVQVGNIIVPALAYALLENGKFFDEEQQETYNLVGPYERNTFNVFPLYRSDNNQTVFIRAPIDDTTRFLQRFWKNVFSDMLNSDLYSADELLVEALIEAWNAGEAATPDLNPVFSSTYRLGQYISGQNPYHPFYQKPLIPYDTYENMGFGDKKEKNGEIKRGHGYYLRNDMLNSVSGGIFRFGNKERGRGEFNDGLAETAANYIDYANSIPLFRSTAGRLLRISNPQSFESQYYKETNPLKKLNKIQSKYDWQMKQGIDIDWDKYGREIERAYRGR